MPYDTQQSPMRALYDPSTQPAAATPVHHEDLNAEARAHIDRLNKLSQRYLPGSPNHQKLRNAMERIRAEMVTGDVEHETLGAEAEIQAADEATGGRQGERQRRSSRYGFESLQ